MSPDPTTPAQPIRKNAIELIREQPGEVDWLFTDIRLPGAVDGWRVADQFRFTYPLRPVVFATGSPNEKPRGLWDSLFLRKPYRTSEVVRAFELLRDGWAVCDNEIEALGRVRCLNFGPRVSWAPPSCGRPDAAE
ncbi:MAG TPA: hypothetical protein VEA41_11645 [Salinarimonas sp.]|nr:hypothetical protein [Salinarimonas sp.]